MQVVGVDANDDQSPQDHNLHQIFKGDRGEIDGVYIYIYRSKFVQPSTPRSPNAAREIHDQGRAFCRSYKALCAASIRRGKQEFPLKPKFHVTRL